MGLRREGALSNAWIEAFMKRERSLDMQVFDVFEAAASKKIFKLDTIRIFQGAVVV